MNIEITSLDIFCKSCILNIQNQPGSQKSDIEFYCKTCDKAICRNCLLQKHISFESESNSESFSTKEVDIKEKKELLEQYERKTVTQRMSIKSLSYELKLYSENKNNQNDEERKEESKTDQ